MVDYVQRAAPGAGCLLPGAAEEFLAEDRDWIRLALPGGTEAWAPPFRVFVVARVRA